VLVGFVPMHRCLEQFDVEMPTEDLLETVVASHREEPRGICPIVLHDALPIDPAPQADRQRSSRFEHPRHLAENAVQVGVGNVEECAHRPSGFESGVGEIKVVEVADSRIDSALASLRDILGR
jgi:hypothetical protein